MTDAEVALFEFDELGKLILLCLSTVLFEMFLICVSGKVKLLG